MTAKQQLLERAPSFSEAQAQAALAAAEQSAGGDLESALAGLAALRSTLGEVDGLALAREARTELEQRGAA